MLPSDGRYMMAALAAMDNPSLLAVKTVVLNPRNSDRGLPQINDLVTMLDSETGLPVAIMDGNWITAVRTAGISAVAAKHMAQNTWRTRNRVFVRSLAAVSKRIAT
jgi:ornithine cyclodeaminase/alanine dehydrogenase